MSSFFSSCLVLDPVLRLKLLGYVPFFELGILFVHAAVVIDFVNFAFGGFNAVIVAVVPLPPAFAPRATPPKAIIRPELHDLGYNEFPSVKLKGHGDFCIVLSALGGDLYLATEIALRHGIIMLTMITGDVNILVAV